MMKVLVLEDDDTKFDNLFAEIKNWRGAAALEVERARNLLTATKFIYERRFDIVIVDLMMPLRDDDATAVDITDDIIPTLGQSEKNAASQIIVLSGFEEIVEEQRRTFGDAGIIVVHYVASDPTWKKVLGMALDRVREQLAFDFVIVVALDKEREAYRNTSASLGEYRNIRGLDCLDIKTGALTGVCIKMPRMGIVNASAVTARAIERFNPRIVAMSGICAGLQGAAELGDVVIADICWEHQAGKWSSDGFKFEHYAVGLEQELKTAISQMIAKDPRAADLKTDLTDQEIKDGRVLLAPMVSGSAVIADQGRMIEINEQHRKLAALDMEMYGVYQAAHLSTSAPLVFGVKTVVDNGDSSKGDRLHNAGAILSARYVLRVMEAAAHIVDDDIK